jgi:hypothetical protein
MSVEYCTKCDQYIDTDFNAEHFADEVANCEDMFECSMSTECPCENCQKENVVMDR